MEPSSERRPNEKPPLAVQRPHPRTSDLLLEEVRAITNEQRMDNLQRGSKPSFSNSQNSKNSTMSNTSAMHVNAGQSKNAKKPTSGKPLNKPNSNQARPGPERNVPYCIAHESEGHRTHECFTYNSEEKLKAKLRENDRCDNCGSKKHSHCERKGPCNICKEAHNVVMHRFKASGSGNKKGGNNAKKVGAVVATPADSTHAGNISVYSATEKSGKRKMLFMCTTEIFNTADPKKRMKANIVMDSGSEQSFTSERAERILGLKSNKGELNLNTFGSEEKMTIPSNFCNIGFRIFDGNSVTFDLRTAP